MVLKIIAFQIVAGISLYSDENSCPKISNVTRRNFSRINLSGINRKLVKKCCLGSLGSVSDLLIRELPKGVLKQELSDI